MTEKPRETQAESHVVELKEKVNNSSLMKHRIFGLEKRQGMARKRFTAEQIIMKLREAEVGLARGKSVRQVCKLIGVDRASSLSGRTL